MIILLAVSEKKLMFSISFVCGLCIVCQGLLNINNIYFDQIVDRIYLIELQLNRGNSSDTEALIWM